MHSTSTDNNLKQLVHSGAKLENNFTEANYDHIKTDFKIIISSNRIELNFSNCSYSKLAQNNLCSTLQNSKHKRVGYLEIFKILFLEVEFDYKFSRNIMQFCYYHIPTLIACDIANLNAVTE